LEPIEEDPQNTIEEGHVHDEGDAEVLEQQTDAAFTQKMQISDKDYLSQCKKAAYKAKSAPLKYRKESTFAINDVVAMMNQLATDREEQSKMVQKLLAATYNFYAFSSLDLDGEDVDIEEAFEENINLRYYLV
ncbi:unnamed protein product, partial [Amoebophrya sp. A25]